MIQLYLYIFFLTQKYILEVDFQNLCICYHVFILHLYFEEVHLKHTYIGLQGSKVLMKYA